MNILYESMEVMGNCSKQRETSVEVGNKHKTSILFVHKDTH